MCRRNAHTHSKLASRLQVSGGRVCCGMESISVRVVSAPAKWRASASAAVGRGPLLAGAGRARHTKPLARRRPSPRSHRSATKRFASSHRALIGATFGFHPLKLTSFVWPLARLCEKAPMKQNTQSTGPRARVQLPFWLCAVCNTITAAAAAARPTSSMAQLVAAVGGVCARPLAGRACGSSNQLAPAMSSNECRRGRGLAHCVVGEWSMEKGRRFRTGALQAPRDAVDGAAQEP